MDAWEIDSTLYRVPNEDIASQVNTVQKIGQKRAFVAATLIGVNASEFFTQDIEDLELVGAGTSYTPTAQVSESKSALQVEIVPNPATDKQRRYIGALMDDLDWTSEYMAEFAHQHKIDLVDMSAADAGYFIDQMKAAIDAPAKAAMIAAVKKLRKCERETSGHPPEFTQSQAKDARLLELEWIDARTRLYTWITSKVDAAPGLEELDDQGLIDLATATARL